MKKIIILSLLLFLVVNISIVYGAEVEKDILPGIGRATDVAGLVEGLINIIIAVGVLLSVIMLSIGGFQYMTQDAGSTKEAAKKTMTQAVLGVLILLAAYLILYIINPQILDIKFLEGGTREKTEIAPTTLFDSIFGDTTPSATVDDLETETLINKDRGGGNKWEEENCDPKKTREVRKNNPELEIGWVNTSKEGECRFRDQFKRGEASKTCSYRITCVRK